MRASEEDAHRRKDNRAEQILKDINKLSDQLLCPSSAGAPGGGDARPGTRHG